MAVQLRKRKCWEQWRWVWRADLEPLSLPLLLPLGSLPASSSPQTSMALIPVWMPTPDLHILEANQIELNDWSPVPDKSVGNFSFNFFFFLLLLDCSKSSKLSFLEEDQGVSLCRTSNWVHVKTFWLFHAKKAKYCHLEMMHPNCAKKNKQECYYWVRNKKYDSFIRT